MPIRTSLQVELYIHSVKHDGAPSRLPDVFAEIDSNKDGVLDPLEVRLHFARLGKLMPESLFTLQDTNKDQRISRSEFKLITR
ncbi:MAG: hypothetical protein SGPRY_010115 [Prymnesium sp.]